MKIYGRNKKVGLVGWWSGKNEGDRYMLQTLKNALGGDFILYPIETPFELKWTTRLRLNRLDFLLVGGGGLFTATPPKPFDTFEKWGYSMETHIGFLCVGIQEIRPEYENTMKQIIKRSRFFIVRDKESLELLSRFSSKIRKAPDLTFLYPRYISQETASQAIGVNLRVWNFDESRTYDNNAWCSAINSLPWEKESVPLSFLEGLEDTEAMKGIEGKKNITFDIRSYGRVHTFIGMRLHSLIFAAQNAIPIIGIAYAPKVRRFFQEMGLEDFCLEITEYNRLNEIFNKTIKKRGEIVNILKRYTFNANAELIELMDDIKKNIKSL